ncbi:MAG: leucine-rich repeat domain-containing protein [Clostridia bacterium]|nr:leucine-rich repeat domain-containing protein [Clostridia bacterium]
MKNKLLILFTTTFFVTLLLLTSCGNDLAEPGKFVLDEDTQTLHWQEVNGAQSYTVRVSDGDEIVVYEPFYSLEYLAPGDYTVFVRSNGDGEVVGNSGFVKYAYRRYAESGLKYQLINNGTEYQLIGGGTATGDVVMEAVYRKKPVTAIADKALYNNQKITTLTISENVKTIGEKAFTKCSNLETVIIPEGVNSLGAYAFQSCKNLKKITLPNSITVIKEHTFAWCSGLVEVTLGTNLKEIEQYAFSNCEALRKINAFGLNSDTYESNLPNSLENIGQYAFTDCTDLQSIHLGNGVRDVALGAFMSCKSLVALNLGESVKTIGECAFQYCEKLSSVAIPDSAEVIQNGAFVGCTALMDVTLGDGLTEVGHSVLFDTAIYSDAEAKNDVLIIDGWLIKAFKLPVVYTIPEGVYGIASYAASESADVQQLNLAGVRYVGYAGFHACASLFKATFDDSLLTLGEAAFNSCPYLATVIVGDNLRSIGDYAFYDCERLSDTGITLPDTLATVGMQAFRNTKAYKNVATSEEKGGVVYIGAWAVDFIVPEDIFATITLADGTYGIANYTFANQTILQVVLADSIEYIGRSAFYKSVCYRLNLPLNLRHIDDYAFYHASYTNFGGNYYELNIPEGTEIIGKSAFYGCENVLILTIPSTVTSIGDYAFYNCVNIGMTVELDIPTGEEDEDGEPITEPEEVTGYITLAEGILSIGKRAFQGCISLVEVNIPNSVTTLGDKAFFRCEALQSIHIGSGVREISDHMFYENKALKTVVVTGVLDRIEEGAFQGCTALTTVDIYGVRVIGAFAFRDCSALVSIVLPETLTTIGEYAFRGCNAVMSFYLPTSVTTIGEHAFYGANRATLYLGHNTIPEGFDALFNSSFRPVILGVTAENGVIVRVCVEEGKIINALAVPGISAPCRNGYVFDVWKSADGTSIPADKLAEAPRGVELFATWQSIVEQ